MGGSADCHPFGLAHMPLIARQRHAVEFGGVGWCGWCGVCVGMAYGALQEVRPALRITHLFMQGMIKVIDWRDSVWSNTCTE